MLEISSDILNVVCVYLVLGQDQEVMCSRGLRVSYKFPCAAKHLYFRYISAYVVIISQYFIKIQS